MKIIAGLGNPGHKYQKTRHNVGFMILDELAKLKNLNWQESSDWQMLIAKDLDYILVKPLTYMNDSGLALRKIMDYYNLLPDKVSATTDLSQDLVVIHDDMDLKLGDYRYATSAGSGGHNGIKSIIEHLSTKNFARYRVGIATPELEKYRQSFFGNRANAFVMKNFHNSEFPIIHQVASKIIEQLN